MKKYFYLKKFISAELCSLIQDSNEEIVPPSRMSALVRR